MKWIAIAFKFVVLYSLSSFSVGSDKICDVSKWHEDILSNLQRDLLSSRQRAELSNVQGQLTSGKRSISCSRLQRSHKLIVGSMDFDESKYAYVEGNEQEGLKDVFRDDATNQKETQVEKGIDNDSGAKQDAIKEKGKIKQENKKTKNRNVNLKERKDINEFNLKSEKTDDKSSLGDSKNNMVASEKISASNEDSFKKSSNYEGQNVTVTKNATETIQVTTEKVKDQSMGNPEKEKDVEIHLKNDHVQKALLNKKSTEKLDDKRQNKNKKKNVVTKTKVKKRGEQVKHETLKIVAESVDGGDGESHPIDSLKDAERNINDSLEGNFSSKQEINEDDKGILAEIENVQVKDKKMTNIRKMNSDDDTENINVRTLDTETDQGEDLLLHKNLNIISKKESIVLTDKNEDDKKREAENMNYINENKKIKLEEIEVQAKDENGIQAEINDDKMANKYEPKQDIVSSDEKERTEADPTESKFVKSYTKEAKNKSNKKMEAVGNKRKITKMVPFKNDRVEDFKDERNEKSKSKDANKVKLKIREKNDLLKNKDIKKFETENRGKNIINGDNNLEHLEINNDINDKEFEETNRKQSDEVGNKNQDKVNEMPNRYNTSLNEIKGGLNETIDNDDHKIVLGKNESIKLTGKDKAGIDDFEKQNKSTNGRKEMKTEESNERTTEAFSEVLESSCPCRKIRDKEADIADQRLRNVEDKVSHLHKLYKKKLGQRSRISAFRAKLQKLELKIKRLHMVMSEVKTQCLSSRYEAENAKNPVETELYFNNTEERLNKTLYERIENLKQELFRKVLRHISDWQTEENDGLFCYESKRCKFMKAVHMPFCCRSHQCKDPVKRISVDLTMAREESTFKDCRQVKHEKEISTSLLLGDKMLKVRLLCKNESVVLLQRTSGNVNFTRNWNDYKYGFGELNDSFWIGLEILHQLTRRDHYRLLIELTDWDNHSFSGVYDQIKVDSELQGYELVVGDFHGDSGDGLGAHNNSKFSTIDVDNDEAVTKFGGSCSNRFRGGWWYFSCYKCNPTGVYYDLGKVDSQRFDGISWKPLKPPTYSFKKFVMSIQRI